MLKLRQYMLDKDSVWIFEVFLIAIVFPSFSSLLSTDPSEVFTEELKK